MSSPCHPWRILLDSTSPFFLYFSFLSFSVYFLHNELFLELDNPIVMESLCYSAAEKSEGTLNASHSFTGYEPNVLTFGELNDSSVSFMIPSSDQDMDDVTLGKMLTEAHRGQVDYCEPEGMSVSQSSSSVRFDGSGQPQSVVFLKEWSIDQGNLMSETARTHRLGLYLKSRDRQLSRNIAKKSVITNSMQLTQKKSADSYKDNYGDRNWNFVKLINKVLQKWRNYGNSRVLPSIRSRDESSSRIRTLFWNLSGRVQELQNEVNCMNDSKDFQDAESVRSGNSHVTSRPVSFPPHPIPEGMLRHSFVSPCRREGPPSIWDTHGISGNVFADPPASSSAPYPQELHQWNSSIEEPLHSSTVEKSEKRTQDQGLRCQSGPSAKDSVIFSGGDYSKNYGADQQRLQTIQIFISANSLHQPRLLVGR